MMRSIPISVIMSVYKEPQEWLCQSIDSILNQTFRDFEFIIICDNPFGKENLTLLKVYAGKDSRIKLIINEENIGLTKSLNKGLAAATGKYIARMDADDISLATRFEKQYSYMESHPSVIVLGTAIRFIGKRSFLKPTDGIRFGNEAIRAQMLFDNCIAHPTVFIRKSVMDENSISYDESYRHSQDVRLWERLLPYGDFDNLKQALLLYRLSEQQVTRVNSNNQANQANKVRTRLQQAWLASIGENYSTKDIEDNPIRILYSLRSRTNIVCTKSYKAFVQFVYLNTINSYKIKDLIVTGDWRCFTLPNLVRALFKH